jgi:hypothetical protein
VSPRYPRPYEEVTSILAGAEAAEIATISGLIGGPAGRKAAGQVI